MDHHHYSYLKHKDNINTLSSSSECVFLRTSDLVLSFSSSSCFVCFKSCKKIEIREASR